MQLTTAVIIKTQQKEYRFCLLSNINSIILTSSEISKRKRVTKAISSVTNFFIL